jgi:hypothetical protein
VPPDLAQKLVEGVFEFLAGRGASSPAAVVAKGVVGNMVKPKASLLIAAAAAALTGLGITWADAQTPPPAPTAPGQSLPRPGAVGPTPLALDFGFPVARPVPAVSHRTANFVVYAASPVVARAVAAEAEFQRAEIARRWLGPELPDWPAPCEIRVIVADVSSGGATVLEYGTDRDGKPSLTTIRMELRGSFLAVLGDLTPHEVTHTVLATFFKKPLPRWADEGIASLVESASEQASQDARCRELLNAGRGIRLRSLFRMTDFPQDVAALFAQGNSVCRFLLGRKPGRVVAVFPEGNSTLLRGPFGFEPTGEAGLVAFLRVGLADGWDKAAKEVYEFESVDDLERAWLDWMKKPESRLPAKGAAPAPTQPDLIPPANLPGAKPEARRPAADTIVLSSRRIALPVEFDPGRRQLVDRLELYVSPDEGKSWQLATTGDPFRDKLEYEAPNDGVYWFHLVTVGTKGVRNPANLAGEKPALKVLIDTTRPVVRVTKAERSGDQIHLAWTIDDANPGDGTTRVYFSHPKIPADEALRQLAAQSRMKLWEEVTVPAGQTGITFSPGDAGRVEVKVEAKDAAGNVGVSAVVPVE